MKTSAWQLLSARRSLPLAFALLFAAVPIAHAQKKSTPAPRPVPAQWKEMRAQWHGIGQKLIDMAEDFPEDKYNFKAQKDQRTFAENLLHVATEDYRMMAPIQGGKLGPALPANFGDLPRFEYKTKADVVRLMKQVVADGDKLLESQGDAGLQRPVKYPFGNQMVSAWFSWVSAIEHSGEHYGQLVVYYRVNGMVPPASRPRPRKTSSN